MEEDIDAIISEELGSDFEQNLDVDLDSIDDNLDSFSVEDFDY